MRSDLQIYTALTEKLLHALRQHQQLLLSHLQAHRQVYFSIGSGSGTASAVSLSITTGLSKSDSTFSFFEALLKKIFELSSLRNILPDFVSSNIARKVATFSLFLRHAVIKVAHIAFTMLIKSFKDMDYLRCDRYYLM